MAEDNKRIYKRFIEEVWNQGNERAIDELISPEYRVRMPSLGVVDVLQGPSGFKSFLRAIKGAIPDGKVTLDNVIGEGDRVFATWTAKGTNSGALFGLPATGRPVEIRGAGITTLSDGKIQEATDVWDMLEMVVQLGMHPAMDKRKVLSMRIIEEAWNGGNLDVIDEIIESKEDRHTMRQNVRAFRDGFRELQVTVIDQVAEGDTVATTWVAEGTHHRAILLGVPPTGRSVSVRGLNIDRVSDGHLRSSRTIIDSWDLLTQLGVQVAR